MTPLKKGALTVVMLLVGAAPALMLLVDPFSPPRDEGTNPAARTNLVSPAPTAPAPPAQAEASKGEESRDDRLPGRDDEGAEDEDEEDEGWKKPDRGGRGDEHPKAGSKISIRIGGQD